MEITKELLEKYKECPFLSAKWINKHSAKQILQKINELGYGEYFNLELKRGNYYLKGCQINLDKTCKVFKPIYIKQY